ncbi:hypothetical protein B9Z55_026138 [Caenorhabditis nigoni]|nr:hypothetical protein B9Z55_026138 [Caenorhabditis nigoni]
MMYEAKVELQVPVGSTLLEKSIELELETSQQSAVVHAAAGFFAMVAIVMALRGLIEYKSRQASKEAEARALLLGEDDEDDD